MNIIKILAKQFRNNDGYVLMLSVVLVSTIVLTITLTLLTLGISNTDSVVQKINSLKAKNLARSCAEFALDQLRRNRSFSGNGSITDNNGSCTYITSNFGGGVAEINTSSTVSIYTKQLKINIIKIYPKIEISQWQEM